MGLISLIWCVRVKLQCDVYLKGLLPPSAPLLGMFLDLGVYKNANDLLNRQKFSKINTVGVSLR